MYKVFDEKVLRNLSLVQKKIIKNLYNAMWKACNIIADTARVKAPVRTGFLRSHIDASVQIFGKKIKGEIISEADYSVFVEMGTSRMRAQPFLRPALTENKDKVLACFKNIIRE